MKHDDKNDDGQNRYKRKRRALTNANQGEGTEKYIRISRVSATLATHKIQNNVLFSKGGVNTIGAIGRNPNVNIIS